MYTDLHPLSLKFKNIRSYKVQGRSENDAGLNTVVMKVGLAKESIKSIQTLVSLLLSGNEPFIKGI